MSKAISKKDMIAKMTISVLSKVDTQAFGSSFNSPMIALTEEIKKIDANETHKIMKNMSQNPSLFLQNRSGIISRVHLLFNLFCEASI